MVYLRKVYLRKTDRGMDKEEHNNLLPTKPCTPGAEAGYCLDRNRQTIRINGILYTADDIRRRLQKEAEPAAAPEKPVSTPARKEKAGLSATEGPDKASSFSVTEDSHPVSPFSATEEPRKVSPYSTVEASHKATPSPLSDFRHELDLFLSDWFAPSPTLSVHTSGSTGRPKELLVGKDRMMQSARLTCRFLGLRPGDTALLCMPLRYIAGKMMVVRALVAGLDLRLQPPSGHPLADFPLPDDLPSGHLSAEHPPVKYPTALAATDSPLRFAAMIPLQVYNTLRVPEEAARLRAIDHLIIGGGAIDPELETALRDFPGAVYSTYGMTETLSHIALRRLSGPWASPYYTPFPSVGLSLTAEGTLAIDAPLVADGRLETNDMAELLPDGRFTILGRKDNMINSGGIKIQIESVEKALRPLISANFALTAVPHPKFGEALVLLVEGAGEDEDDRLRERMERHLPPYHVPKHILAVDRIPLTGTGKISRAECRRLATDRVTIKQ